MVYRRESSFDYLVLMRKADDGICGRRVACQLAARPGSEKNGATAGHERLLDPPVYLPPPLSEQLRVLAAGGGQDWRADACCGWISGRFRAPRPLLSALARARLPAGVERDGMDRAPVRFRPADHGDARLQHGRSGAEAARRGGALRAGEVQRRAEAQWLPSVATIEVQTPLQHWKNIHHFTDYKHFTVKTRTKTEAPK